MDEFDYMNGDLHDWYEKYGRAVHEDMLSKGLHVGVLDVVQLEFMPRFEAAVWQTASARM